MLTLEERHQLQSELGKLINKYGIVEVIETAAFHFEYGEHVDIDSIVLFKVARILSDHDQCIEFVRDEC